MRMTLMAGPPHLLWKFTFNHKRKKIKMVRVDGEGAEMRHFSFLFFLWHATVSYQQSVVSKGANYVQEEKAWFLQSNLRRTHFV